MARTGRPRTFDRSLAVEQAMHVFWARGYDAASLALLKEAMGGISSPSFYAAFDSKEALFEEVLRRYADTHGTVSAVLHDDTVPPRAAVEAALRASARMQTDTAHPRGCLLVVSATTTPAEALGAHALLSDDRAATRKGFADCVRRGVELGDLPPATDPQATALMLDTFMRGMTTHARSGATLAEMDAAIACLLQWWPAPTRPGNHPL